MYVHLLSMHIFSQFLIHVRIPLNYTKHTCSLIFNASLFSVKKKKEKKKESNFSIYIFHTKIMFGTSFNSKTHHGTYPTTINTQEEDQEGTSAKRRNQEGPKGNNTPSRQE